MEYYASAKCGIDVDKYLKEPENEDECLGEDSAIITTLLFENGFSMDVKCCGVQYEPGEKNAAWTEAVLFNKEGNEVNCSEIGEEYFGEWALEYEGDKYYGRVDRCKG